MSDKTFTREYKEAVIACLVHDKSFLQEAFTVLKPEHFEEQFHVLTIDIIFNIFQKTAAPPSRVALQNELINRLIKENRAKTNEHIEKLAIKPAQVFIERLYAINGEMLDVKQEFLEYFRAREMENKLLELHEKVRVGEIKSVDVMDEVRKTYTRSNKVQDKGLAFFETIEDVRTEFKFADSKKVTTGFKTLDEYMDGGPTTATLTTFMAPPKGGKSMALINVAHANCRAGRTVFHFTLEISANKIRRRMMSRITGFKMRNLPDHLDESLRRVKDFWTQSHGKLYIKEYASSYVTCDDFRSYIYMMQSQGIKPDVIIIDYGDLVRSKSRKSTDEERLVQSSSYFEMRQMMSEFDAAGFTASQCNREAVNKEKIRMDLIAESFAKVAHSDHIVSVCQTEIDAAAGKGRLFFAGSREGNSQNVIPIMTDWTKSYMGEPLLVKTRVPHEAQQPQEPVVESSTVVPDFEPPDPGFTVADF